MTTDISGNTEIERSINKLEREIQTPFFHSLTKLNVDEIFSAIKSEYEH